MNRSELTAALEAATEAVIDQIAAERRRQIESEGWSAEHDDQHTRAELALAASCYAWHAATFHGAEAHGIGYRIKATPPGWPWDRSWWKPKDRRRDLVRAAALIVAEIERLDRAALKAGEGKDG